MDNSQSIMSDDSTYFYQFSEPIAVLKMFWPFYLKLICFAHLVTAYLEVKDENACFH